MACIAEATIPSVKNTKNLFKLRSFNYVKKQAFDILARSFYKTTSIYMCSLFSSILIKNEDVVSLYTQLNKDSFLDYLYQGLNDFVSKEKRYSSEFASSVLAFKIFIE